MDRSSWRNGSSSDLDIPQPSVRSYNELGRSTVVWPPRAITLTRLFIFAVLILVSIVLTMFSWSAFAVDGVNLPGHDYDHFNAPSASVCRNTCGGESRCQAYIWVKPGIQGLRGVCLLKRRLHTIVIKSCRDTGLCNFIFM